MYNKFRLTDYSLKKPNYNNIGFNNIESPLFQNNYGVTSETIASGDTNTFKLPLNTLGNVAGLISDGLEVFNTLQNYKINNQSNRINYNLLNMQELSKLSYADTIEIQAQENINQARAEFNKRIGDLTYSATRRGVKTTSGTIQNDVEQSARNFGEDEQKLMKQASRQANNMRLNAYANYFQNTANYITQKESNRYNRNMSLLNSGLNAGLNVLSMFLL